MADNYDLIGVKAVVEGYNEYLQRIKEIARANGMVTSSAKDMGDATKTAGDKIEAGGKKTSGFGKEILKVAGGFLTAQAAVNAFTGAIKLGIGNALNFEKGIDAVGAISGATAQELDQLSETALRIGKDTAFSASQAVDAMQELAAGGIATTDIINGAADAVATLAAAGGTDLKTAADIVATSMTVWGASTSELTSYINRLAGVANVSRFAVEDMQLAIAMGGGAAATAGVEFSDFSTVIAATAASFSSGSDAGTSFKTFITALPGNSVKAKKAIQELGLEFYNADGSMRAMSDIVQELHDKLGPLSQQQQTVALKTIFGNDAFRTAAGLMKLTGEEFTAMSREMENTSAQDVAAQRMDNLAGKIEEFKGSVETVSINLGMQLIPILTKAAEFAGIAVDAFGGLDSATQNLLLLGAAAIPAAYGIMALTSAFLAWRAAGGSILAILSGPAGIIVGIVALGIAIDQILKKTTGAGLFERIFGDPAQAAAAKEVTKEIADRLTAAGTGADKAAVSYDVLTEKVRAYNEATLALNTKNEEQLPTMNLAALNAQGEAFRLASEATKAAFTEMQIAVQNGGITILEAKEKFDALPESLQAVATGVFDVDAVYQKYVDNAAGGADIWDQVAQQQKDIRAAVEAVPEPLSAAALAIFEFGQNAEGASLDFDDLVKKIDALTESVTDLNPQVVAAKALHAAYTEELGDLKAKTTDLTDDEKARVELLEKQVLPALKAQIDASNENKAGLDGQRQAMVNLMGADAYGAFLETLTKAGKSSEDMTGIVTNLSGVYSYLANNDIPTAVSAFVSLRDQLSDEEWGILAEAIGPELMAKIKGGISDPEQQAALEATLTGAIGDVSEAGKTAATEKSKTVGEGFRDGIAAGLEDVPTKLKEGVSDNVDKESEAATAKAKTGGEAIGGAITENIEAKLTDQTERDGVNTATTGVVGDAISAGEQKAPDAHAIGTGIITGIESGITPNNLGTTLSNAVQEAIRVAKAEAGIQSPSTQTRDEVGKPIMQGIAEGIEDGEDIVVTALDNFILTIAQEDWRDQMIAQFGSIGAGALEALGNALDPDAGASEGKSLANAVTKLIKDAKDRGVPDAEALGTALIGAIQVAIETHTPEAIEAARAAIGAIGKAAVEEVELTVDAFKVAFAAIGQDRALAKRLGSAGSALMDALRTAIEEGGQKNIDAVAKNADDLVAKLNDKLPPDAAKALGTKLMDALTVAIETKSPEAITALEAVIARINSVIDGGAYDIQSGLMYTSSQIDDFAARLGVSAKTIVDNISFMAQSGILAMLNVVDKVPDEVRTIINRVLKDLNDKKIDFQTAIDAINKIISGIGVITPGGSGSGSGGGTGTGTFTPNAPGTTGSIEQGFTEVLGFNPFKMGPGGGTVQAANGYTYSPDELVDMWLKQGPAGIVSAVMYGGLTTTAVPYDPTVPENGPVPDGYVDPVRKLMYLEDANPTMPGKQPGWVSIGSFADGLWRVPSDGFPAILHRGETVLTAEQAAAYRLGVSLGGGSTSGGMRMPGPIMRGDGVSSRSQSMSPVVIDLRGAQLTGTIEDNEAMMTRVAQTVLNDQIGRDAFLAGVEVLN